MHNKTTEKYGLFTAIAMIVGIVIGSGIFFKSDNILTNTGGNVLLGVLLFSAAALSIIFGSLSIAQLARTNNQTGGLIAYIEEAYGQKFACAFGWFQLLIYYPTLAAVVAWVFGVYAASFFGLGNSLEVQVFVGLIALLGLYGVNIIAAKVGAIFQNATTVIKLLPLIAIAIAGLFWGDTTALFTTPSQNLPSASWLGAIGPIAFSFDGWVIATSVSHEIKHAKRNLPLALVIAPLVILAIYIAYFVGICALIGPEQVMALGDQHVALVATTVFGNSGAKIIIIFVMISVLGTVNGIVIGNIRLPYALALRNMVPFSSSLSGVYKRTGVPISSAFFSLSITLFWLFVHYFTQKSQWLPNADISEIAIVMSYLLYIALYLYVINLYRQKKITNPFLGVLIPSLAIVGSLFILYGGAQNALFIYYAIFCLIIMALAVLFYPKKHL